MKLRSTILFAFILSQSLLSIVFAQNQNILFENTPNVELSAGAQFHIWLQNEIKEGRISKSEIDEYIRSNANKPDKINLKVDHITSITTFDGFGYDDNFSENRYYFVPPDPIAAAGPDNVIAVVNTMIECRTSSGSLVFREALMDFFTSLSPVTYTFDPKVIYDQYEDRFIVLTLEFEETESNPDTANSSKILIAVSKDSSPSTATSSDWYYHEIDAKTIIDSLDTWIDYPGFAIDEEAIYITGNMFTHYHGVERTFKGVRLWIIDKGNGEGFYAGESASAKKYDPYALAGGGYEGTTQPAHVFGPGGIPGEGSIGTFLIEYTGLTLGGPGGIEGVGIIRIDDPLGSTSFTPYLVPLGDIEDVGGEYGWPDLPDAPQLGSTDNIEVNDRRALHAVWRDDALWMTTTINPNKGDDAGETTAFWMKFSTSEVPIGSIILADTGRIGGEDIATGTYTFFPSVAVNSNGDAIFGFSASAPTIFAGAYYAARESGDAAGTVKTAQTIKAGVADYTRKYGGSRNRWGDYSGASVDPSDDITFWIFNEYAAANSASTDQYGHDGRWGTVYAKIPDISVPVELITFVGELQDSTVLLNWETSTETNNYGFDVERGIDNIIFEKIGFVRGSDSSNSLKSYSFTDSDLPNTNEVWYRLKQIDNDGDYSYSKNIRVDISAITGIEDESKKLDFKLAQNYPNPFNPVTLIPYSLKSQSNVIITIINPLGEVVKTLVSEIKPAGNHEVNFNASSLSSGIYFYSLQAKPTEGSKTFVASKKMILLK